MFRWMKTCAAAGVLGLALGGTAACTERQQQSAPLPAAAPQHVAVPAPPVAPLPQPAPSTSTTTKTVTVPAQPKSESSESQSSGSSPAGASSGGTTCELNSPPKFDDPAHPNYVTNKDCGYVDSNGNQRSHDPWIDGQLQDAQRKSSGGSSSSTGSYSISSGGMSWLSSNWPTLCSALASGNSSAVSSAISNAGPDPAYQQKIISQFKANYPADAAKLGLG